MGSDQGLRGAAAELPVAAVGGLACASAAGRLKVPAVATLLQQEQPSSFHLIGVHERAALHRPREFVSVKNQKNWIEFSIKKDKYTWIRFKVYDKSLDKLTSLGISNFQVKDPLAKILLTNNKLPEILYNR